MGRVTSNKYGEKGRRTVKPKSIKTKSIHLSSTRKLARMGKDQKKGHSGSAASYYTRSQALRKLQITLRDFRRLCILRGIYPREPKKLPKRGVHNHTYYHKKDIAYLAYEPLLDKFRAFKSFMKKVRKAAGRGNHARARAMHEEDKPEYSLDHIIRDRFPTFVDAVADVDDALCMVHLFATLPAKGRVSPEVTAAARRQAREWQLWCCHAQVLRKVFLSVKGIYYQAEIMGQKVTWLVPYAFTQEVQSEVDFRVMSTFFEFYQTFLGFVLFRLYHESAMAYPPTLSDMLDRAGLHLGALSLREESAAPLDDGAAEVEESASAAAKPTGSIDDSESFVVDEKAQKARLASLSDALSSIDGADDGATAKAAKKKAAKAKSTEEDATFAASEEAVALKEKDAAKNALTTLFDGLCIFVSRETPVESLEFVIRSFGGTVAFDGDGSPCDESDARITHHIVDRPKLRRRFDGRECVLISVLISVSAYCLPRCTRRSSHLLPSSSLSPILNDCPCRHAASTPDPQVRAAAVDLRQRERAAAAAVRVVRPRRDASAAPLPLRR